MLVKPMDKIRKKWQDRVAVSTGEYTDGVANPKIPWDSAAKAAEPNYEQGVQAGMAKKRFGKGVVKAGNAKWQKGATEKGAARWPTGVSVAGPDFESGFSPYRGALESTTLTPRKAKRDPSNLQRVNQVVQAMIKTAEAQGK